MSRERREGKRLTPGVILVTAREVGGEEGERSEETGPD
jgi:hypothetical protein